MAHFQECYDKDGYLYYKIQVSSGRGRKVTRSWHPDPGWSAKTIKRERDKFAAELEISLDSRDILTRKEEAEKKRLAAIEAAKLKTVRQYADGVFMPSKEATFSENARSCYRMFLDRHILPVLGDTLLTDVTPAMISKMLLDFQKKGYAHATAVKFYNILNGIFDMAFLDGSIPVSPMLRVKRPAPRRDEQAQTQGEKAYTGEQVKYIKACADAELEKAREKSQDSAEYRSALKWRAYIYLLCDSGMRKGEACGLQWSDFDFKSNTVTIQRSLQYTPAKGVYTDLPKNGKSRTIDVDPEVLRMLRELRDVQAMSCISQWVFTQDKKADPIHPQSPTRYFKKFGNKYGIEDCHAHKFRHTWASLAEKNGADIASIALRLGHSDSSVTMRMYVHSDIDSMRRAGDVVRESLKEA